jgi:prepilin-type N-terminal cleavage/methylation domain-containing protein
MNKNTGYTLIELMVAVTLFVILGTLVSGVILYSTRNATKSESMTKVRGRMDFAVQVLTRQLREAKGLTCTAYGTPISMITYTPQIGPDTTFSVNILGDGTFELASGSAKLIADDVRIVDSNLIFTCTDETLDSPATVRIKFTAKTAPTVVGIQSDDISVDTLVKLNN